MFSFAHLQLESWSDDTLYGWRGLVGQWYMLGTPPSSDLYTVHALIFSVPWHSRSQRWVCRTDVMCYYFLCLCQDPGGSSNSSRLWISWITLQLQPQPSHYSNQDNKKLLLSGMYGAWLCACCCCCCTGTNNVRHGDAAEWVAMCASTESPPPHATLLMARCIWWRLPPTHQRPPSPTRERHLVDSGCNYSPTSLLPSPWPILLYTQNNLWCEALAFSSDCTSTVGQGGGRGDNTE